MGYPGESDADFAELEEFVREVRFERLGVFTYSEEEGTYSAEHLADDVPEAVKQQRAERIMALQRDIAREANARRTGRTERVIVDGRQGDFYIGRTQYDSPEVDQEILIPAGKRRLLRGRFYDVASRRSLRLRPLRRSDRSGAKTISRPCRRSAARIGRKGLNAAKTALRRPEEGENLQMRVLLSIFEVVNRLPLEPYVR